MPKKSCKKCGYIKKDKKCDDDKHCNKCCEDVKCIICQKCPRGKRGDTGSTDDTGPTGPIGPSIEDIRDCIFSDKYPDTPLNVLRFFGQGTSSVGATDNEFFRVAYNICDDVN